MIFSQLAAYRMEKRVELVRKEFFFVLGPPWFAFRVFLSGGWGMVSMYYTPTDTVKILGPLFLCDELFEFI